MATSALPLTGSVVVDLSDECLGLAGRLLADLGADVVRVEAAGGDGLRIAGPHLAGRADIESGLRHLLHNAGKRSPALNFDAPGAWDLVDRLLGGADIVLAPLQKSPAARRVLASDRLRQIHPHLGLVDAVMKRGGETLPASDLTGVAAGGVMYGLGYPGAAPDYPAGRLAYKQASLVGAATAVAMLYEAKRGRPGSHACISLQEAITSTTLHFANENMWRLMGVKVQRRGGDDPTLLQAQDGAWLSFGITPNTPARWEAYARWLHERAGYDGLIGAEFPGEVWAPAYGGDAHRALERACASLPRAEKLHDEPIVRAGKLDGTSGSQRTTIRPKVAGQQPRCVPTAGGRSTDIKRRRGTMPVRTTVVGSWPIPFGQRPRLKEYYAGAISDDDAAQVLTDAARIAMDEQRACGLDQIMGGEVFAPDFLHHVPPRLAGLKTLRPRDTAKGYEGVGIYQVIGPVTAPRGTGHAKAFRRESAIEPTLAKASVPSPLTIGGGFRAAPEIRHLADLVAIVQDEIREMIDAGLQEIQLDAPAEAVGLVMETRGVEELVSLVAEPLQPAEGIRRTIHLCLGDISRTTATTQQNLHSLLPLIQALDGVVDRVHVECSYDGQWNERAVLREIPDSMEVIAGIADVKSEPASERSLRDKIGALLDLLPPERLLVSSSCGCGRVPHDQAIRLMRNLVKAATQSF